jgi:hypothetical protein
MVGYIVRSVSIFVSDVKDELQIVYVNLASEINF